VASLEEPAPDSIRKLAANPANAAAMFDAVGDVTLACLVGVMVESHTEISQAH
jgi:hypothetical protein